MKIVLISLLTGLALLAGGSFSNRRAPGFSLMDSHFQQHDLQDYLGKVVILDFMQTSCPVCNSLADTLVEVEAKYGEQVAVLSVVTLPDNFAEADKFALHHKAAWPILFDSGQVMMSYLKLRPDGDMNVHFPHVFIIDGGGTIRNDFDGSEADALKTAALIAEIDKSLK